MLNRQIVYLIVCLFIFISCSGKPSADGKLDPATFTSVSHILEETLVLSETDDYFFGQVSAVQPTSRGDILVGDRTAKFFHLFDRNGNYRGRLSQEGSGPGEFSQMGKSWVSAGDTLIVHDFSHSRISAFTIGANGRWAHAYDMPLMRSQEGTASSFYHYDDGKMLGLFRSFFMAGGANQTPPQPQIYEIGRDGHRKGELIATIRHMDADVQTGTNFVRVYSIPFGRNGFAAESKNALHLANSDYFGATTLSVSGDTIAHFIKPVVDRPVLERDIQALSETSNQEYFNSIRDLIPDLRPAFDAFTADEDGNVYFRFNNVEEKTDLWLKYTSDGDLLASFHIPNGTTVHRIRGNTFYTSVEIEGEPTVIIYRLSEAR